PHVARNREPAGYSSSVFEADDRLARRLDAPLTCQARVWLDDETHHQFDRVPAQRGLSLRRVERFSEDARKGSAVRNVEEAQRADLPMQLERLYVVAEKAGLAAAPADGLELLDRSGIETSDQR